jgi:exosortase/archaeosortase family protein
MPSNLPGVGGTLWRNPVWLLGLLLAALWPHWIWMARRTVDGSDEPWGLVALLTIVVMVVVDRRRLAERMSGTVLALAASLTLLAALCTYHAPPIVAGAIAILSVTTLLAGMLPPERPRAALAVMALLALPLVASLNFYLGYPLRWLCSHGVAALLSVTGWQVTPEGAALLWNGKTILVDAPCAGIAMLWVGVYAAALMSYAYRASTARTVLNLLAATAIMVAGNLVRNSALFFKEVGIVSLPQWTHEAIGLLVFGLMCWAMYHLFSWRRHAHH